MKQIIAATNHEASRGSPPALPSPVHSPGKHPNSQKIVQASASFSNTGKRPDDHHLNLCVDPNLSKLQRDFHSWANRHPGAHTAPSHFTPLFDAMEREALSDDFLVKVKSEEEKGRISVLAEVFALEKEGMDFRRASEHVVAERFRTDVADLGSMPIMRNGGVVYDHPADVADKLFSCRQVGSLGITPGGESIVMYEQKCGLAKICPDEARAESKRLAERYVPAVELFLDEKKTHQMFYLVPTKPNYPLGSLAVGKKEIFADFKRRLEQKCFSNVEGAIAIQEDPLSVHIDWNIHLNVILLVDGWLDYKAVRESWGHNVEIMSQSQMSRKTRSKLENAGIDTSRMTNTTILAHAFKELSKYAAAPLTSKSIKKSESGASRAPPFSEWPAVQIREWYIANKWFRRTRTYGCLYDVEGYRYTLADDSTRRAWFEAGGLDVEQSSRPWRKGGNPLSKESRGILREVMKNKREVFEVSLIQWVGSFRHIPGKGYTSPFDLILDHKSVFTDALPTRVSQDYRCKPPTGPPPDPYVGGGMAVSLGEYARNAR